MFFTIVLHNIVVLAYGGRIYYVYQEKFTLNTGVDLSLHLLPLAFVINNKADTLYDIFP